MVISLKPYGRTVVLAAVMATFWLYLPVAEVDAQGSEVPRGVFNTPGVSWSAIGPGGGGWLSSITVVDDEAHTVYVACDVGGIYKSTDHGDTWEIKNTGLGVYYVQDIAVDPVNPSTIYAGTRGGIYKSTNGGDLWTAKRNGFPPVSEFTFSAPISDVVVDPKHPNIIYAGVGVPRSGYELESYHWQTAGVKGAIFKSTDFGESWVLIQDTGIDPGAMVYSLAIDPGDSDRLYAATSAGVYTSNSAGAQWIAINSGLPHGLAMGLVIDPVNSETLYVTLWAEPGSPTWEGGVFKSTDGGHSWVSKNDGLPQVMGDEVGFTSNFPHLLIDQSNPQTLYVGNTPWTPDPGIYKSTDGGENWEWISRDEPPDQNMEIGWIGEHGISVKCMAIDPGNSDRLYFGTSTHLFKTENAGIDWTQAYTRSTGEGTWQGRGIETTVVQDIAIDPTDPETIYVGYWDMGLLKTTDGGLSFKRTFNGMNYRSNTFSIVIDPDEPSIVYAATGWWEENEGEVCKSTDYGESWTVLDHGIPDAQVWSIALDSTSPADSRTLYAASYENGVYKTIDGGQTWFAINNGLGVNGNRQIRKVIIDPNNSEIVYAGIEAQLTENGDELTTIQGGLFKSTNGGSDWVRIDLDLPQVSVWDVAIDPSDSETVYSAVSSEYDHSQQIEYDGGVFKSTDGGTTWERVNNGLGEVENLNVVSVAISPEDPSVLYVVTTDDPFHDESRGRGIFRTADAGEHWRPVHDASMVFYFDVITIDPSNANRLYAGSSGNGILKGVVTPAAPLSDEKDNVPD